MSMSTKQTMYVLEYIDDCGGNLHPPDTSLYMSIPSLVDGIANLVNGIKSDFDWLDDDDSDEEDDCDNYYRDLYYYNPKESLVGLSAPTLEHITEFLTDSTKNRHDDLLIKIGAELGAASSFACEIRVYARIVNA